MGLKSGSRDAELDESEEDTEQSTEEAIEEIEPRNDPKTQGESGVSDVVHESRPAEETETVSTGGDQRPSMSSIPYKLRREKVNEGREQVPYFLREEIIDAEDKLQSELEELLGEDVYKSDYREASMVVAQRNPELVAEILREWGYDLDAT
jgi:hypothetical protein